MRWIGRMAAVGVLALAGCSGLELNEARALGEAGIATSSALVAEAEATDQAFRDGGENARLLASLGRQTAPVAAELAAADEDPEIAALRGQIEERRAKVQEYLVARIATFRSMQAAYDSFAELAVRDAKVEAADALSGLVATYNRMRVKAEGVVPAAAVPPPVDDRSRSILAEVAGLVAAERQRRAIGETNQLFLDVMPGVLALVKAEERPIVSIRRVDMGVRTALRDGLISSGLADVRPTVDRLAGDVGLAPSANANAVVARNPRVQGAMLSIAADRDADAMLAIEQQYVETIAQLEALIEQHERLKAGEALTLATLVARAQEMRALGERIGRLLNAE